MWGGRDHRGCCIIPGGVSRAEVSQNIAGWSRDSQGVGAKSYS